ncbi:MAG: hypothetical protein OEY24_05230 [Candidatus Bathyarchaeota archaeon]|nr:hypothetical protein [Candidatus Bathyarchaeota archaeon]MDH5495085.1 hypothetical protein [Candidatus Bathyarchaeota archaeon]
MRSDYLLYIFGVILLVVVCYTIFNSASLEEPMGGMLIYNAIVFVLALFGITAFIFGYSLRPKKQKLLSIIPSPAVESLMELTRIKE